MEFKFNPVPANPDNPPFHNFLPEAPSVSDQESSSSSDCSSTVCSSSSSQTRRRSLFPECLAVELTEGQTIYELIRRRFTSCLSPLGKKTTMVAIHRRNWSGISDQARVQSFKIHSKAVENKNGVSPNVKFARFGHGRDRILEIFKRGFSCKEFDNIHGAVFLSPDFALLRGFLFLLLHHLLLLGSSSSSSSFCCFCFFFFFFFFFLLTP